MSKIDIEALLQEVEPGAPCGPDLEYDAAFTELEKLALGKPEVQYGTTITPAVMPEWKQIRRLAMDLLERSRDLRLAVYLLRADLSLQGLDGLADSLSLIERLLNERWDHLHPALDVDDDMDATLRVNSLAVLADSATVLKGLKEATLIVLPGLGPLSFRLLEIANGELAPPDGQEKMAIASIEAALVDVNDAQLKAVTDAICRSYDSVMHIEKILMERVGHAQTISLDGLTRMLKRGRDFMMAQVSCRNGATEDSSVTDANLLTEQAPRHALDSKATSVIAARLSGDVINRAGVVQAIDKILKYYEQHEPSSPLPLLLGRARSLVSKNFLEILEDLAPDSLAGVMALRGNQSQSDA